MRWAGLVARIGDNVGGSIISRDLRETGFGGRDRDLCWALVWVVINLWAPGTSILVVSQGHCCVELVGMTAVTGLTSRRMQSVVCDFDLRTFWLKRKSDIVDFYFCILSREAVCHPYVFLFECHSNLTFATIHVDVNREVWG